MEFLRVGKYRINIDMILYYSVEDNKIKIFFDTNNGIHDIEIDFSSEDEFNEYQEVIDDMLEVEVEDIDDEDIE